MHSIFVSCTVNKRTKRFRDNLRIIIRAVKPWKIEAQKWNDLSEATCSQVSQHVVQCPWAVTQERWPAASEKGTGVFVSWTALLWAVWATAAVPVALLGLKHLLATSIQTLLGSWLRGLTPAMCLAASIFPAVVSLAGRGAGTWAHLQAGGTLARWWLGLSGATCCPEGSWRWGFAHGWDTNLALGRSASISSMLSASVMSPQL